MHDLLYMYTQYKYTVHFISIILHEIISLICLIRALVQHRDKGTEHVSKILRRSSVTPFIARRREGRLGTSDLPLPPPCSPIPVPFHNNQPFLMKTPSHRPNTKEVKKTIKETKELLKMVESQRLKKRKTKSKRQKMEAKSSNGSSDDDDVELNVFGEHQVVGKINKLDHIRDMKKKDGKEIREAESEINNMVTEMRKRVPPVEQQKATWPKDSHTFIRAHATMSLSMLNNITRKQNHIRRKNEITKKAEIVSRVKDERERRKERIYQNQQMIRDTVMIWRMSEERRLQEKKEQMELEQVTRHMKNAESLVKMVEHVKNKKEEEKRIITFSHQNNMLDKMVHKEKTKLVKKSIIIIIIILMCNAVLYYILLYFFLLPYYYYYNYYCCCNLTCFAVYIFIIIIIIIIIINLTQKSYTYLDLECFALAYHACSTLPVGYTVR